MYTIVIGVNYLIASSSQLKQAIKASKNITNTVIEVYFTENLLNLQNKINQLNNYNTIYKYTNNGSFFSC